MGRTKPLPPSPIENGPRVGLSLNHLLNSAGAAVADAVQGSLGLIAGGRPPAFSARLFRNFSVLMRNRRREHDKLISLIGAP